MMMNKESKFFMVCEILKSKNKISNLAPHNKLIIEQTIDAVESIEIDSRVNPTKSFSLKYELWIAASFFAGGMVSYLINSYI